MFVVMFKLTSTVFAVTVTVGAVVSITTEPVPDSLGVALLAISDIPEISYAAAPFVSVDCTVYVAVQLLPELVTVADFPAILTQGAFIDSLESNVKVISFPAIANPEVELFDDIEIFKMKGFTVSFVVVAVTSAPWFEALSVEYTVTVSEPSFNDVTSAEIFAVPALACDPFPDTDVEPSEIDQL